jgi:hypothetical protein
MENNNQQIKKVRMIGIIGTICFIIIFFLLLINNKQINGYLILSYPIVLGLGLFFSGLSLSGKIKVGLKYLSFILAIALLVIVIAFLLR